MHRGTTTGLLWKIGLFRASKCRRPFLGTCLGLLSIKALFKNPNSPKK